MTLAIAARPLSAAALRHSTPDFHAGNRPVRGAPKDGFEGFGAELNPYLYANRPGSAGAIASKLNALNPRDVRIFVPTEVANPAAYARSVKDRGQAATDRVVESFYQTVKLAVREGANINLTFNGLMTNNHVMNGEQWHKHMGTMVDRFAGVVDRLTQRNGGKPVENLHLTFDNEPSGGTEFVHALKSGHVSTYAHRYAEAYGALDARLNPGGQRNVELVAGDVTREHRREFLAAVKGAGIEKHIDAWSFHLYPRYGESLKGLVGHLHDVKKLAEDLGLKKPLTLNEFGIKGYGKWRRLKSGKLVQGPGNPGMTRPYTLARDRQGRPKLDKNGDPISVAHGVPVERTGKAAFMQGWFALAAARMGFQGAVKWEAYDGGRAPGYNAGQFGMIGPKGTGTTPSYGLFRIFDGAVRPGWKAVQGSGVHGDERATFFRGPNGGLSALAMNAGSGSASFQAGGFPRHMKVYVATWTPDGRVRYSHGTSHEGRVAVSIPAGGAIALSTVPFEK